MIKLSQCKSKRWNGETCLRGEQQQTKEEDYWVQRKGQREIKRRTRDRLSQGERPSEWGERGSAAWLYSPVGDSRSPCGEPVVEPEQERSGDTERPHIITESVRDQKWTVSSLKQSQHEIKRHFYTFVLCFWFIFALYSREKCFIIVHPNVMVAQKCIFRRMLVTTQFQFQLLLPLLLYKFSRMGTKTVWLPIFKISLLYSEEERNAYRFGSSLFSWAIS